MPDRCRDLCLEQPLLGSASLSHWLVLVDQPRPWKSKVQDSLLSNGLGLQWYEELQSQGQSVSLLARHSQEGRSQLWAWRRGQVLQLEHPQDPEGSEVPETLLVCCHGSRDACCGSLGVPLAQQLRQQGFSRVWEVSHLGGHRFAPTFWHLPSWRVYGRLPVESDTALGLEFLRGNAAYSPPLQVFEAYLRRLRGQWPLLLEPLGEEIRVTWSEAAVEEWQVEFASHSHQGPMSCRDVPEVLQEYRSFEVLEARRL